MKIYKDQMYFGAALTQIAEHLNFTAINSMNIKEKKYRNAYLINNDAGLYMKYASRPTGPYQEYQFTFNQDHLEDLLSINNVISNLFIGLVLVDIREICCLKYTVFSELIKRRSQANKHKENQYSIMVTAPIGKRFRAYINKPYTKNTSLGRPILIKRNAFPSMIMEQ